MRWYGGELVDRHGQILAEVVPLASTSTGRVLVWEVHVRGHEVVRAASLEAGRVIAQRTVCPPRVEREGHR